MSHLNAPEKQLYVQTFLDADTNGDGYLDRNELADLCRKLGYRLNHSKLNTLYNYMDLDKNGKVTLDEFLSVMPSIAPQERQTANLRRIFNNLDVNKDGVLSKEELSQGMSRGGIPLKMEEVEIIMKQADKDGNGELDYEEFISLAAKMKRK